MKSIIFRLTLVLSLVIGITSCTTMNNSTSANSEENSILGKWELVQINQMEAATIAEAYPMGAPVLNFISNKMLSASDGCNSLNGGVTVSDGEVTFGDMMSTMKACANVEDNNFSSKLKGKLKYTINDDKLLLIQGDIVIMTFVRPSTLAGTWELEEFIGKDKSMKSLADRFPNKIPMLTFQGNRVSGNDGCNGFNGAYISVGSSLTMKNLASTKMFCEGVDDAAFMDRFNNVNKYEIINGKLVLFANDVKTMVFKQK